MPNFKLTIQYDGTEYHGWQIQPGQRTIQGELTRVGSLLDHQPVTVHGAGRTDAGVHAEAQVASVRLQREIEPAVLRDAFNGNLDRDIRIVGCEPADDSFHARYSAVSKTYAYRIWTGPVVSPFLYRYVYHQPGDLDTHAMQSAARVLLGRHDFRAFTIKDSDVDDWTRTIMRLDIEAVDYEIRVIAQADGFLRFMVRTIVGTLLDVGRSRVSPDDIGSILAGKEREKAGATAPAAGLTLLRVDY
jgi:tRNA pseudouridine38-40 synthase